MARRADRRFVVARQREVDRDCLAVLTEKLVVSLAQKLCDADRRSGEQEQATLARAR